MLEERSSLGNAQATCSSQAYLGIYCLSFLEPRKIWQEASDIMMQPPCREALKIFRCQGRPELEKRVTDAVANVRIVETFRNFDL